MPLSAVAAAPDPAAQQLAAKVAPHGAIAATERSLLAAIAAAGGITRPDVERVGHFTQRTATEAA